MSYLDEKIRKDIIRKFSSFDSVQKIILFGSRARGDAKKYSDIDIAVEARDIDLKQRMALYDVVEQLETLLDIDLVLLDETSPDFCQRILREGEIIYVRSKS